MTAWSTEPTHALSVLASGCTSDDEALRIFLSGYRQSSPHTLRAYVKESTRFLLWLRFVHPGQPAVLPKVTPKTVSDYIDFLSRGGTLPESFLKQTGWHRRRAPFSGKPLSAVSRAHTLTILMQMFDLLSNLEGSDGQAYCRFNPLRGGRAFGTRALQNQFNPTERGLSFSAWRCVQDVIANPGDDPVKVRARWVIFLLYYAFLRRDEACRLRMGDFTTSRGGWQLRVLGKGGAIRQIVVNHALLDELVAYRRHLGLPPYPAPNEGMPAIASLRRGKGPVHAGLIYAICRDVFTAAEAIAREKDLPDEAAQLKIASPHWLRHTGISHAMELGVEPRYVQAQARHSSLAITALYDHKDRDAWAASMEKMVSF